MDNEEYDDPLGAPWPSCRECESCFLLFGVPLGDKSDKCEWCRARPVISSIELLKRRLSVIDHTYVSRYPYILKHLAQHILLKE